MHVDNHNPQISFVCQGCPLERITTSNTHADLPSTSSLPGLTPFLARIEDTFSTSPLSAAFINRSSYLFQSAACYNKGEKSKLSILHTILVRLSKEGETREGKQYCLIHHSVVKCISNSFLLAILTWWKEPFQNTQYTRNILYIIYLRKRGFLMFSALFSLPSEQRKERN